MRVGARESLRLGEEVMEKIILVSFKSGTFDICALVTEVQGRSAHL